MKIARKNRVSGRSRGVIGTVLASAMLFASVGIGVASASASSLSASESAFCKTIFTYHPTTVPNPKSFSSYRAWARALIPFYEKLASEAPTSAAKAEFNEIVVILKLEANSANFAKLDAAVLKYHAKWQAGAKAIATAVEACAKSLA